MRTRNEGEGAIAQKEGELHTGKSLGLLDLCANGLTRRDADASDGAGVLSGGFVL
jgi:hypothetical protein